MNIYKTNGFQGYFRGLPVLILRDSIPFGFYFYLFEWMRREGKRHRIDSPIFVDLVCGGLAGKFYLTCFYNHNRLLTLVYVLY